MSSRSPFRRDRGEETEPAAEEETTADETVEAPAAEAETTTAMGDCAICHLPVTSDQEYVQASYGLVHRDVCGSQTHRQR